MPRLTIGFGTNLSPTRATLGIILAAIAVAVIVVITVSCFLVAFETDRVWAEAADEVKRAMELLPGPMGVVPQAGSGAGG